MQCCWVKGSKNWAIYTEWFWMKRNWWQSHRALASVYTCLDLFYLKYLPGILPKLFFEQLQKAYYRSTQRAADVRALCVSAFLWMAENLESSPQRRAACSHTACLNISKNWMMWAGCVCTGNIVTLRSDTLNWDLPYGPTHSLIKHSASCTQFLIYFFNYIFLPPKGQETSSECAVLSCGFLPCCCWQRWALSQQQPLCKW